MQNVGEGLSYLFLCDGIGLGGLELQMLARYEDALERGHKAVLACSRRGRLFKYAEAKGIRPEPIEFNIPYYDVFAIYRLGKIAKKYRTNVCVVGQSQLLSQVLIARKVWRLPMAVVFYRQMQSGLSKRDWFHDRIYSQLDAAITSTHLMKDELVRTTVMPEGRIHVLPYGVRPDLYVRGNKQAARSQFAIPTGTFVVGCIGRFDPQKDQMLLLEAFAKARMPAESVLVFAGEATAGYEDYRRSLEQRARDLQLTERVRFLPFTKEVPTLLSAFDIFVMPSRSETFGLVVIEAMAAEVPVIATDGGGVPEIIDDGITGLLFPPRDEERLTEHLSRLAGNSQERLRLGSAGKSMMSVKFDHTKQANLFFEVCGAAHKKMAYR